MTAAAGFPGRRPVLVIVGGLPGTGKTTICLAVATELHAAYVRVDTIEAAIADAEGPLGDSNQWRSPPGYEVGYAVAAEQLRLGLDVVVESVNPVMATRDAWRDVGLRSGCGHLIEVEVVCADRDVHRRRAEERHIDVPGLTKPTWDQICKRHYEPWGRERLVVDTATLDVADAVRLVWTAIVGLRGQVD